MVELKVYLSGELDKRFRRAAMEAYGYGRGSLSKAAAEALTNWCNGREHHETADVAGPVDAGVQESIAPAKVDVGQSNTKYRP